MNETRENILRAALRQFSRDGYAAASVSSIAGELGLSKSALYKHYAGKRDLFDSIVARMEQLDAERARSFGLPESAPGADDAAYQRATLAQIAAFSAAQFRWWTEDEFAAAFRRLLTVEQFRSDEAAQLYAQYLSVGPLRYTEQLFCALLHDGERARMRAEQFYAPLFLGYSRYDAAEDQAAVRQDVLAHVERCCRELEGELSHD